MARAIKVLLQVDDKSYDINSMSLIKMTFNRYLGRPTDVMSGVLSDLDITMFDETGYKLLGILQRNRNQIRLKYGFDDDLSETYLLTAIKVKSNFDNMGASMAINGIAQQIKRKFSADIFLEGTPIESIVRQMAKRNNWYIGESENENTYVDLENLVLPRDLTKSADETDFEFLYNKVRPLCNKTVTVIEQGKTTVYWDLRLVQQGANVVLYFRPYSSRKNPRKVWKYTYGTSTSSNIINLTNQVDMSYLLDGLTIKIPITAELLILDEEQAESYVKEQIMSVHETIEEIADKYNIPLASSANDFKWNIEFYQGENLGNTTVKDLLLKKIEEAMLAINTCQLTVIGNPRIMPMDLIELIVKNKDGNLNILSSNSSGGSYWRIISIKEEIGISGYETTMDLVREVLVTA